MAGRVSGLLARASRQRIMPSGQNRRSKVDGRRTGPCRTAPQGSRSGGHGAHVVWYAAPLRAEHPLDLRLTSVGPSQWSALFGRKVICWESGGLATFKATMQTCVGDVSPSRDYHPIRYRARFEQLCTGKVNRLSTRQGHGNSPDQWVVHPKASLRMTGSYRFSCTRMLRPCLE